MNGISDRNAASMVSLKKTYTIGGEQITLETGKLGLLINGAVTISDTNDNILFVTTGFKTKGNYIGSRCVGPNGDISKNNYDCVVTPIQALAK